jgi:hypothetical protein
MNCEISDLTIRSLTVMGGVNHFKYA